MAAPEHSVFTENIPATIKPLLNAYHHQIADARANASAKKECVNIKYRDDLHTKKAAHVPLRPAAERPNICLQYAQGGAVDISTVWLSLNAAIDGCAPRVESVISAA